MMSLSRRSHSLLIKTSCFVIANYVSSILKADCFGSRYWFPDVEVKGEMLIKVLSCVIDLSQNRAVIAHNLAKLFVWYIKIQ
jgi:hypothetical protein